LHVKLLQLYRHTGGYYISERTTQCVKKDPQANDLHPSSSSSAAAAADERG